jgi:hypothetical protein
LPPAIHEAVIPAPGTECVLDRSHPTPYWVFVCNPKKWAIDDFLTRKILRISIGSRQANLGSLRVGVDQRSKKVRNGKPALKSAFMRCCATGLIGR